MSPFGLFDLLKTLLPTPDQTPSSTPDMQTENKGEPTQPNADASTPAPLSTPPKSNACADFLYRHEQRAQGVKNTKKRLD